MGSPARAAARARVAELRPRGRKLPRFPSWAEAAEAADLWLAKIQVERGKKTMRVLENIVEDMMDRGKWLLDDRHAWQIAQETDVSPKWVLESLCSLERDGIAFRVHMAGLKSRHGLTSNVPVFPELMGLLLDLIPRGARAATIQFLRRTDVRAQLEAGGVWARLPEAVTQAPIAERPAVITGTRVGGTASETLQRLSTVEISDRFSDHDRSPLTPPRFRAVEREVEGGAVAPSPHIAPSAASTVSEGPTPPAPPAAGERRNGPRLVPPTTHGPRAAGSRSEAGPTPSPRTRGRAERTRPEALQGAAAAADGDQLRATLRKSWGLVAGGPEFLGSLAALRFASRAWDGKLLVVRMAGPPETLEKLKRYRTELEAAGGHAVGVPLRLAWEGGT
jgi:hypothetical protein